MDSRDMCEILVELHRSQYPLVAIEVANARGEIHL